MKGFKKGVSGNPKGKPPGAVNKVDAEARALFLQTLENQVPNLKKAFAEVFEKDKIKYLELYVKYAQYFIPKKTDITSNDEPIQQQQSDWFPPMMSEIDRQKEIKKIIDKLEAEY